MGNCPENGPLLWPVSLARRPGRADRATAFHARAGTVGDRPERGLRYIFIPRGGAPGMKNCPENSPPASGSGSSRSTPLGHARRSGGMGAASAVFIDRPTGRLRGAEAPFRAGAAPAWLSVPKVAPLDVPGTSEVPAQSTKGGTSSIHPLTQHLRSWAGVRFHLLPRAWGRGIAPSPDPIPVRSLPVGDRTPANRSPQKPEIQKSER
jgi:hypothetical protein